MKQVTTSASKYHATLPNLPTKPSSNHSSVQETVVTLHQPSCVRLESKSPFICKGGCAEQGWTKKDLDHGQDNLRFNISTGKATVDNMTRSEERSLKAPQKQPSDARSNLFGGIGRVSDRLELLYDIEQGRTVSRTNAFLLQFMSKMHMHCREPIRTDSDRKVDRVLNNEFNLIHRALLSTGLDTGQFGTLLPHRGPRQATVDRLPDIYVESRTAAQRHRTAVRTVDPRDNKR